MGRTLEESVYRVHIGINDQTESGAVSVSVKNRGVGMNSSRGGGGGVFLNVPFKRNNLFALISSLTPQI